MDKRALSLPILIAIVVGNMVGTGIFLLPSSLAAFGTISIVSWAFTAVGAMLMALTFTRLNKRYPKTGGAYAYCREAFGDLAGFIIALIYWLSNVVSVAGIAIASVGYLGFVFPGLNASLPGYNETGTLVLELGLIWIFTLVNIMGIHFAGVVQLFLTIIKTTPLILIILFGMGHIHLPNLMNFSPSGMSYFSAISNAAAITFWAFVGLEAATVPAENTMGPKDIYHATIWGTLISSAVYISSTIVLMGMIPVSALQNSQFPFAEAGAMIFGPFGALLIAIFACISGIGAMNVCILLQGQIIFAAARDNIFPHFFAKLSKKDVPVRGQLVSSLVGSLLLIVTMQPSLLKQFSFVALLSALLSLVVYLVSMFAEIKFVMKDKEKTKHIFIRSSTIVAVLAAAYSLWMIASMDAPVIKVGALLIIACIPFYYLFVPKKKRR